MSKLLESVNKRDFDRRISEVVEMLGEKQLYGTISLIKDLKYYLDLATKEKAHTCNCQHNSNSRDNEPCCGCDNRTAKINKAIICMRKGLKLVMENPYSEEHFLRRYWCYSPAVIDRDRRDSGDYFKKPTQYWFLNCEPQNNLIFEPISYNAIECKDAIRTMTKEHYAKTGADNKKTARSMIHPQYADRFIRQYILDEKIWRDNNETLQTN